MNELNQDDINKIIEYNPKTARNISIYQDRLKGKTYNEIAKKYGISNSSVSYILNKGEIQDLITSALNHLASFAPIIVKNYRDLLNSQDEKIRLKATHTLAQIIGIAPSNKASHIQNLYVTQNNITGISDTMRSIIKGISIDQTGDNDIIDAEFEDILNNR